MDKTLIPGAKNEELKALFVKVRPAFVSHLEHAKLLQTKMMASHEYGDDRLRGQVGPRSCHRRRPFWP